MDDREEVNFLENPSFYGIGGVDGGIITEKCPFRALFRIFDSDHLSAQLGKYTSLDGTEPMFVLTSYSVLKHYPDLSLSSSYTLYYLFCYPLPDKISARSR